MCIALVGLLVLAAACEHGMALTGHVDDASVDDMTSEVDADVPVEVGDAATEAEVPMDLPAVDVEVPEDLAPEPLLVFAGLYAWGRELIEMEPAAGAIVALDLPGGERIERTAGVDGLVVFEDYEPGDGTSAVTVWTPGRVLTSRVGIAADVREVTIPLFERGEPSGMVEISGQMFNMDDETSHCLFAWASVPSTHLWRSAGPDLSMNVLGDVPFLLVLGEHTCRTLLPLPHQFTQTIFHWIVVEHAPLAGPEVLDVDFDHAAPTNTVHGSFPLPDLSDTVMLESGWSRVHVKLVDGHESAPIGDTTNSVLDSDEGRFEYDVEWANPELTRGRLVTCYCIELGGYTRPRPILWNCMDGAPTAGEHDLRFIDVRMIVPTGPRTRHPLHEPIEFEVLNGAGARPSLAIYRDEDLVWWVEGPADAVSLVVPQTPSTADVPEITTAGLLESWLSLTRNFTSWTPFRGMEGHTAMRFFLAP